MYRNPHTQNYTLLFSRKEKKKKFKPST